MRIIFRNLIRTSFILSLLFFALLEVLHVCGLQLRGWALMCGFGLIALGFAAGIIQLFMRTTNLKRLFMAVTGVIAVASGALQFTAFVILLAMPGKEYVTEIDGHQFVGYEEGFMDTMICFHDVNDFLTIGAEERFTASDFKTDEDGRTVFYVEPNYIYHLEDIPEYRQGEWSISDLRHQ